MYSVEIARTLIAFLLLAVSTSPSATQNTIISGKILYHIVCNGTEYWI